MDLGMLRRYLLEMCADGTLPTRLITREDGTPYLYRYYLGRIAEEAGVPRLTRNDPDRFGAFVHRFVSSDAPSELHGHPWGFSFAVILSGSYTEERIDLPSGGDKLSATFADDEARRAHFRAPKRRTFRPFDVNIIEAHNWHRIDIVDGPVWTLFVHGPRVQEWGFINRNTGAYRAVKTRTFEKKTVTEERT